MAGPLDYLKTLIPQPTQTPEDDQTALAAQSDDPWYMKAGRAAANGVADFTKGVLGVGDQGPAGATATNAGQMVGAALPFLGAAKALKGVSAAPLAMDEASRAARATEQGFTNPMYHGTFTPGIEKFKVQTGHGDFGVHVSPNPDTAAKAVNVVPGVEGDITRAEQAAQIMPLQVRMNKTLNSPDMNRWRSPGRWVDALSDSQGHFMNPGISNDPEMMQDIHGIAKKYDFRGQQYPTSSDEMDFTAELKDALTKRGYDSISYPNFTEGQGEPSYLLLDPRNIRSKNAAFDPAKLGKTSDIMAGLSAPLAGLKRANNKDEQ